MRSLLWLALLALLAPSTHGANRTNWGPSEGSSRSSGRLLNIFSVVTFPNDACTSGTKTGVCYSSSECSAKGGSPSGSCAQSFGVCCFFSGNCGGSTSINNTYFASTDTDTSSCSFSVCKASDDICMIRLNFDTFNVAPPSTQEPGDAPANGRTQCQKAQFSASGGGTSPTLCGSNTGQHMLIEPSDTCNTLTFSWTSTSPRAWDIHIIQIGCDDRNKPPEGCTQFHTGTTGYIQSYNYAGGKHLANQDYNNCIRTERGYCSISYTQVATTDFSLSATVTYGNAVTGGSPVVPWGNGDPCDPFDQVIIMGAKETVAAALVDSIDKYCGVQLNADPAATSAATIFTSQQPFMVAVLMDGTEVDTATAGTIENSNGFNIYYSQVSC